MGLGGSRTTSFLVAHFALQNKASNPAEKNRARLFSEINSAEKQKGKQKDIDARNYAKYILKEGSIFEKRELLSCLKSKLVLKNKKV